MKIKRKLRPEKTANVNNNIIIIIIIINLAICSHGTWVHCHHGMALL
jgi:hypothetical protein